MQVSTSKISMTRALCVVAVALVWCATGQAYAQDKLAQASITIVNDLGQSLVFKDIQNRQAIQIKSDPPAEIPAHSSGQFKVEQGTSMENLHLNIEYTIKDTADQVGIVYKLETAGAPHCPKEHPDWTTESVKNCGDWDKGWTYTFAPQ